MLPLSVIPDYFGERIFFETVSQFPNLEALKLKLWEHISGNMVTDHYKQIPQWQTDFKPRVKQPALIVLDDVWSQTELEELVLRVPCCKTLVLSRVKFPTIISSTFELELLQEDESLSLFCCSAFGQESVPDTADKNLVKQVYMCLGDVVIYVLTLLYYVKQYGLSGINFINFSWCLEQMEDKLINSI